MRRHSVSSLLTAALAASGFALIAPGCAENDSMLFVVGVMAVEANCTVRPDATALLQAHGVLDREFTTGYTGALLVGNQITQRGSREQLRTETSRVALRGAEVILQTPAGAQLAEFSTVGTGFVDPAAGADPSYAVMFVDMIPPSVSPSLPDGRVVARVRVFGDTLGGEEVTSSELAFPIDVCTGCLIFYPAEAADPTQGTFMCQANVAATGTETDTLPCEPGQDQLIPCTLCAATHPMCRDPALNPSL
jgi:hypothetical protein